nr:chaperone protein ClpB-like isoform X2 [Ziziphus jujuba var. spinosa]
MASATSFSATGSGGGPCLVQPVPSDRFQASFLRQGFHSKPNSNSLVAKTLQLKKLNNEFAYGLARFLPSSSRRRFDFCCKASSSESPRISKADLAGLFGQAIAMSSEEEWQKIVEKEYLMKVSHGEFTVPAWEAIAYCPQVAKENQHHIVETEHLMKAILERSFDFSAFSNTKDDKTSLVEATDKFIQFQPKAEVVGDQSAVVGPYLEILVQRAIQYKKECGHPFVNVEHLLLAFSQDERFGKHFIDQFQLFQQLCVNNAVASKPKPKPKPTSADVEKIDMQKLEADLSFLKNKQAHSMSSLEAAGEIIKRLELELGDLAKFGSFTYEGETLEIINASSSRLNKERAGEKIYMTYLQLIKQKSAKSLPLKPFNEFTYGFPRFLPSSRRFDFSCQASTESPRISKADLAGLFQQAIVMSSEEEWQKIAETEHLMKITYGEFTVPAWEAIAHCPQVAKENRQGIVESEHLMKAILERSFDFSAFSNTENDKTCLVEATDKFIQIQPKAKVAGDQPAVVGPFLKSLIQRAIQYKKEYGHPFANVEHLLHAFSHDERFGKHFIEKFQLSQQFCGDKAIASKPKLKPKPKPTSADFETIDVQKLEADLSFLKNKQAHSISFLETAIGMIKNLELEMGDLVKFGSFTFQGETLEIIKASFSHLNKERVGEKIYMTYLQLIKEKIEHAESLKQST